MKSQDDTWRSQGSRLTVIVGYSVWGIRDLWRLVRSTDRHTMIHPPFEFITAASKARGLINPCVNISYNISYLVASSINKNSQFSAFFSCGYPDLPFLCSWCRVKCDSMYVTVLEYVRAKVSQTTTCRPRAEFHISELAAPYITNFIQIFDSCFF